MSKWVAKWEIQSESNPQKFYTVSRAEDGEFGCSCPQWVFRKKTCKHIRAIVKVLNVNETESAIANRLRFIAKMNLMKLSCDNCAKRNDSTKCPYFKVCGYYHKQDIPSQDLFYVKGGKDTFYLLGRCCKHYEKAKDE